MNPIFSEKDSNCFVYIHLRERRESGRCQSVPAVLFHCSRCPHFITKGGIESESLHRDVFSTCSVVFIMKRFAKLNIVTQIYKRSISMPSLNFRLPVPAESSEASNMNFFGLKIEMMTKGDFEIGGFLRTFLAVRGIFCNFTGGIFR